MSLSMYLAVLEGYQEHLFDLKCIAVHSGYWSGYYNNTKHASPLSSLLERLFCEHKKKKPSAATEEVDVEKFLQRERNFRARMQRR